jgi:D-glycero-D-manno-heptose 1,7-bisphosphate phosphatase
LDRDGVINFERKDHVKNIEEFKFIPGVLEGLRELANLKWPIIVVTNQSAVGRGMISRKELERINEHMIRKVKESGGRIDRVFYCPHKPEANCGCRKPGIGLFEKALKVFSVSLVDSWFIGDKESDRIVGETVGCKTIMIQGNCSNALKTAAQSILEEHSLFPSQKSKN